MERGLRADLEQRRDLSLVYLSAEKSKARIVGFGPWQFDRHAECLILRVSF